MKKIFCQTLTVLSLGFVMAAAHAQAPANTATAAQQTQAGLNVNALNASAANMLSAIDAGLAAKLFEAGSPELRKLQNESTFTKGVQDTRKAVGIATARRWQSSSLNIVQQQGAQGAPGGEYINISFITTFTQAPVVREMVSMRLDEDRTWRFIGYALNNLTVATTAK